MVGRGRWALGRQVMSLETRRAPSRSKPHDVQRAECDNLVRDFQSAIFAHNSRDLTARMVARRNYFGGNRLNPPDHRISIRLFGIADGNSRIGIGRVWSGSVGWA